MPKSLAEAKASRALVLLALAAVYVAAGKFGLLFAFVNASGNVGRSRGVVSTTRLEEGRYEVAFTEPVTKCAFTAPIGVTVSTSPNVARPAMVAATGDDASEASTGVIVQTYNSSGVLSSLDQALTG